MLKLDNVTFSYASPAEKLTESVHPRNGEASDPETSREGVQVLKNVSLEVKKGELVILTGPSGCGKTTVLRLFNGLIPEYFGGTVEGKVEIDGRDAGRMKVSEISLIAGTVFQNPRSQFFNADSTGEMAFACENRGMDPDEIERRILRTGEKLGMKKLLGRSLFRLSGGERQKIACGSVDVCGSEVILLDEPSANLDYAASESLHDLIKTWKNEGKTILVSEHRLAYLADLADRIVIMNKGIITGELNQEQLRRLSSRELGTMGLRGCVPEAPESIPLPDVQPEDEVMTLSNFDFRYGCGIFSGKKNSETFHYDDIRIAVNRITAVTGCNGVGKTTFLNCLCGMEKKCRGTVVHGTEKYDGPARLNRFFMVMQDVNHQLFAESVEEELMLCMVNSNSGREEKEARVSEILRKLDLYEFRQAHPMSLSGGQKQRVAIACALCSDREFLLFDEPTSGLDYGHMLSVAGLLKDLRDMGKTVIVVTHDSELIRSCCDRMVRISGEKVSA